MTDHLPPPDWRRRVASATSATPRPPAPATGSGLLCGRGTVTSEQEAWWVRSAPGTGVVRFGCVLVGIAVLVATGALARFATGAAGALAPYAVLLVVLVMLLGAVPVAGVVRLVLGLGLLGLRRAGGPGPAVAPGRQLTVATARGEEEVVLATARRIPAGSRVTVLGPRWFGCRHAWAVRYGAGRLVVARGVLPCLASVLAVAILAGSLLVAGDPAEPVRTPVPADRGTS